MKHDPQLAEPDGASFPKAIGPRFPPPGSRARAAVQVLLVEDDELVRECLGEVLDDAGWRVGRAADAEEALGRMALFGAPGVLVADLALGGHLARPARFQPAQVLIDALGPDAGGKQEVALRRERLAAVVLGEPHVADEAWAQDHQKRACPGRNLAFINATAYLTLLGLQSIKLRRHKETDRICDCPDC